MCYLTIKQNLLRIGNETSYVRLSLQTRIRMLFKRMRPGILSFHHLTKTLLGQGGLTRSNTSKMVFYIEVQTVANFLTSKKARLLAQGYEKEYGLYYAETSPSVQLL